MGGCVEFLGEKVFFLSLKGFDVKSEKVFWKCFIP